MALSSLARALVLVPALLLLGCGTPASVQLPAKPVTSASSESLASPAPLTSGSPTTRERVVSTYLSYWQAYGAALKTRDITAAKKLLAPYTDASYLSQLTDPMPRVWSAHQIGYGYAIPHVLSVAHTAGSAVLHDCLDLSRFGTQNTRTGRVVPGSFGLSQMNFYVTLTRSRGHWVISRLQQVEVPCSP